MDALEQCLAGTVQELQALERLLAEPGEGTAHADLGQHVQSYVSGLGHIKDAVTRVDPTLTELVVPIHMMDVVDKGLPAQDSTATLQTTRMMLLPVAAFTPPPQLPSTPLSNRLSPVEGDTPEAGGSLGLRREAGRTAGCTQPD